MKKWLVTVSPSADMTQIVTKLLTEGGTLEQDEPIDVGEGEKVVTVIGPDDLPSRMASTPGVIKLYPASDMDFY